VRVVRGRAVQAGGRDGAGEQAVEARELRRALAVRGDQCMRDACSLHAHRVSRRPRIADAVVI
jgi:hypothetical protein